MTPESTTPAGPVPSPCVGICCIGSDGLCFGCFRTRPELAAWGKATEAEKLDILARCRDRQRQQSGAT